MSDLQNLPVSQLQPNPWNRTVFDPQKLEDLAVSIKAEGVREPLKVRATGPNQYQIASGNRRWLAAQKTGLTEVPCLIETLTDEQVAEDNITLNIQREDIPPLEMARMVSAYMEQFDKTQEETGKAFGKSRVWVTTLVGFLKLDPELLENVSVLTLGWPQLEALKSLPPDLQKQIATELQNGTLKPENIQKRCNQLRFGSKTHKIAPPRTQVSDTDATDPVIWDEVETAMTGWTWSAEYPKNLNWAFQVNLETMFPDNPKKTLGQWFLAMATALGETHPDAAVNEQLQNVKDSTQMYAEDIQTLIDPTYVRKGPSPAERIEAFTRGLEQAQKGKDSAPLSKASDHSEDPSAEEQIRAAKEYIKKYGRLS